MNERERVVVDCIVHDRARETWVTCIHTADITTARRVESEEVAGEAVCGACRRLLDAGRPAEAALRVACGECIRARFPLEGAS